MVSAGRERASDLASQTRAVAGTAIERVRENPIPAALIGLGIGWWIYNQLRDRAPDRSYGWRESRDYQSGRDWEESAWYEDEPMSSSPSWTESASAVVESTQERVGEIAGRARERVGNYATRAQTQLERLLHENPFVLGAAALAVGAALAASIPRTRAEHGATGRAVSGTNPGPDRPGA